jgi:hypothetical protein
MRAEQAEAARSLMSIMSRRNRLTRDQFADVDHEFGGRRW